jgi:hypothetical protein
VLLVVGRMDQYLAVKAAHRIDHLGLVLLSFNQKDHLKKGIRQAERRTTHRLFRVKMQANLQKGYQW